MKLLKSVSQNLVFLFTTVRDRLVPKLVPIERRVARFVALGCTDEEISAITGRPVKQIRRHIKRAMKKAGIADKAALAKWAVDNSVSPPGDMLSPTENWGKRQM